MNAGLAFNRWTQRTLHVNANIANKATSQTRPSHYPNIAAEEIPPHTFKQSCLRLKGLCNGFMVFINMGYVQYMLCAMCFTMGWV